MRKLAPEELFPLAEVVDAQLEQALNERDQQGMSVQRDFDVTLYLFGPDERAKAFAYSGADETSRPGIGINVLSIAFPSLNEKERTSAANVFRIVRGMQKCFPGMSESDVLEVIENPKPLIKDIRSGSYRSATKQLKERVQEYGDLSLDEFTKLLSASGPQRYQELQDILLAVFKAYTRQVSSGIGGSDAISSIRHELDHVDFYQGEHYRVYQQKLREEATLEARLRVEGEEVGETLARVKEERLLLEAESLMLLEGRAHFLTYVVPGEQGKARKDTTRELVYRSLLDGYVRGKTQLSILDTLISCAWAQNEMDLETSRTLFRIVHRRLGREDEYPFTVAPGTPVREDVIKRILEEEMPRWTGVFADHASAASYAFAEAYFEAPHRLKATTYAKSFGEAIEACYTD